MQSVQRQMPTKGVTNKQRTVTEEFMWQSEGCKRRRLDMQESSHSVSGNPYRRHLDSPRPPSILRTELKKMCQEVEAVSLKRKDQPAINTTRPTYRAQLARRGYLVRETLGSGTYSKVKMALDFTGQSRRVAVKIVDKSKAPRDYQEKFMPRELEIWPKLKHRNLVDLREWFQNSRRVFMVLEYAEGGDVLKYIQTVGAIMESLARRWILQVADAIRYLHLQDITHRDLKLENLLLDSHRNIKICDFGFIKGRSSRDLSQTYCGSKSYAAPEILLGRPYDPKKADLWAMGVILYIFVTGKMPFDESRGTQHILEEQRELAFPWAKLCKVSVGCKTLIRKLFTWGFAERPNISEILQDDWLRHCVVAPSLGSAPGGQGEVGLASDCTSSSETGGATRVTKSASAPTE